MHTYLQRLRQERDSLTQTATALTERAASDDRDLTDAEQAQMTTMQERCAVIDGQLTTYSEQLASQRAYAALRTALEGDQDQLPATFQTRQPRQVETRSPAEQFTDSEAFRNYRGRGSMEPVELELRAPTQVDTWPLTIPPHNFQAPTWTMSTPLLDVCGSETVSSNVVEWFSWPVPYPEAGVVAEGAAKPEALYEPTPHTDSLETLAHWKPISRQALDDIPRIQSIIEGALRGGVLRKMESLMAAAITGAVWTANTTTGAAGQALLEVIRIAYGEVQGRGYATPNAVLLNPADYAAMDISTYYETNGGAVQQAGFWGMRAVPVPSLPAGSAYVGEFKTAATLFTRKSTAVYMTDSHADYFVKNLLVILAEGRALAALTEQAAAQKCVYTAPAPPP